MEIPPSKSNYSIYLKQFRLLYFPLIFKNNLIRSNHHYNQQLETEHHLNIYIFFIYISHVRVLHFSYLYLVYSTSDLLLLKIVFLVECLKIMMCS